MTVYELVRSLEQFPDHAEIRLVQQLAWEFEYDLRGVSDLIPTSMGNVVYLVEGEQIGYLPEDTKEKLSW